MNDSAIGFRMADLNDIKQLIKVRFDFFAEENWDVSTEQSSIIKTNLHSYYKEQLNKNLFVALAEKNGQIISVAFLAILEKAASPSFPTGKIGTLLNVMTYPDNRKMGYARKLLDMLIEQARYENLSFIELMASPSGKPLYQKLGFQEVQRSDFTPMKLNLL